MYVNELDPHSREKRTEAEHRAHHVVLHQHLDMLVADFIDKTGKMPSWVSVTDLMKWSHEQTIHPSTQSIPLQAVTVTRNDHVIDELYEVFDKLGLIGSDYEPRMEIDKILRRFFPEEAHGV